MCQHSDPEPLQGTWINASLDEQTGTGGCRSTSLLNAREGLPVGTMITCSCILPPVTGFKDIQVLPLFAVVVMRRPLPLFLNVREQSHVGVSVQR